MFVKNNAATRHKIGKRIALMPGVNEVDDKEWAKVAELPLVKHYMEMDPPQLEVVGLGKRGSAVQSLDQMTVDEASKLIGETYDRDLLKKWKKKDDRKGIHHAIDQQLELMKLDETKRGEEDAEPNADDYAEGEEEEK
jgi:hypothetical protein